MHPFLIGLLGFCGFVVLVGIPVSVCVNIYRLHKLADGSRCRAIIIDRTGTVIRDELWFKDRERVFGYAYDQNNKRQDFDYFAVKGYVVTSLWPPGRSRIFQVPVPTCVWVEGVATPPDIVGPYREGGKLDLVDSARMVAHQRAEKATMVAAHGAEALAEALQQGQGVSRNISLVIMIIGFVIVLIGLVAVGVLMNNKLEEIATSTQALVQALTG